MRCISRLRAAFAAVAAAAPALLCSMGASPATGEPTKVLPWVLGGIGLAAVIALVVLTVLDAKKKKNAPPPPADNPPPAPPTEPRDDSDDGL